MTRRKFVEYAVKTALAIAAGAWAFTEKVAPRSFVRAVQLKYPGQIKLLSDIHTQGKWSG